ncbi:putative serine incorporator/TMS membrane protein [Helianthus debilis subsp. tardiflorus]
MSGVSRDWLTIISFVIALLAMVIATFSTGIDSQCFQSRKDEKQEEDDVPYGYGFFHLVFASGVMYFAMLLIGWNSHHTMQRWTIDVGWTSTWVRIVNEWLAVCVYLWMLVAPIVWKSRKVAEEPK